MPKLILKGMLFNGVSMASETLGVKNFDEAEKVPGMDDSIDIGKKLYLLERESLKKLRSIRVQVYQSLIPKYGVPLGTGHRGTRSTRIWILPLDKVSDAELEFEKDYRPKVRAIEKDIRDYWASNKKYLRLAKRYYKVKWGKALEWNPPDFADNAEMHWTPINIDEEEILAQLDQKIKDEVDKERQKAYAHLKDEIEKKRKNQTKQLEETVLSLQRELGEVMGSINMEEIKKNPQKFVNEKLAKVEHTVEFSKSFGLDDVLSSGVEATRKQILAFAMPDGTTLTEKEAKEKAMAEAAEAMRGYMHLNKSLTDDDVRKEAVKKLGKEIAPRAKSLLAQLTA